jgi:riboflavin-specific deaminase-like protein
MSATIARDDLLAAYELADRATPRVRMNFVTSLDGSVTVDGRSGGLGNEDDRRILGVLRAMSDVLLVGAGTVRAEGYGGVRLSAPNRRWREERGLPPHVPLAVISRSLDLDPRHPFFSEALVRPMVVTHAGAPTERREALDDVADVIVSGETSVDVRAMLDALAQRGLLQVLCEGGPHLFGDLLEADVVDELCLTLSPVIVGGAAGRIVQAAAQVTQRMSLVHAVPADDFVFLRYARAA